MSRPELPDWPIPEDVPEPPDEWEETAMRRIEHIDWGDLDPRRDPSFWYRERASRRSAFKYWESEAREEAELNQEESLSI